MSTDDSMLIHPPALRRGDRVHVISPSGPVTPEILEKGLAQLQRWELDVHIDEGVYRRRPPFDYLAGEDEERLEALRRAYADPECRAVFCSRGGYGAMRLLPHLDAELFRAHPRLFIGFSDITALHLYVAGICGVATLHAPVIKSLPMHVEGCGESLHRLEEALFATRKAPRPWTRLRTIRGGVACGPVFGGNLSLLIPLLCSPYCPDLDGAIIVVEEVGEQDYRLDRLLTALRLSDADIAALVLGEFSNSEGVYVEEERFADFVAHLGADFDCPVVTGAPVGHEATNFAFPVGVDAELDADEGILRFQRHAAEPR